MAVSEIRRRPDSALIGLLFVFLGVVLLLTSIEAVSFGIWLKLLDYWPVLLVLIGVEILLAEAPFLMRAGIVSLTLLAAVAAAYALTPQYEPVEPLRVSFTEPAGEADTLHLDTNFLAGDLQISSATTVDGPLAAIVRADFSERPARVFRKQSGGDVSIDVLSSGPYVERSYEDGQRSGVETLNLPFGSADWVLEISPDVEVDIGIASMVADLDFDLRNVNMRALSLEGAAAQLRVHLPLDAGESQVDIATGFAEVEIIVPEGVAVFIDIDAPLGKIRIDADRFVKTQDGYRSIHYSDAANRVDIDIEALSANVTVN